jgi:threonine aldolase
VANFRSDNVVGAHDAVLHAIAEANTGVADSYGHDDWSRRAEGRLQELFACDLEAYLVLTGTAANALALSTVCPPHGQVLCHAESHVVVDECGAPELLIGGGKLTPLPGVGNKLTPAVVAGALDGMTRDEHQQRPSAISLTQVTELGTVYTLGEIQALAALARERGLRVHMDGARVANALVHLGCSPAEMTWQAGVEVLSFGATKNGALACEAVIFFDRGLAADFRYKRKRAGQLLSKGRFLGAQMLAYLEGDLWLANARHANAMAQRLARVLAAAPGVRIPLPVDANEIFAVMPATLHGSLLDAGIGHGTWSAEFAGTPLGEGEVFTRWITSYRTTAAEIDEVEALAAGCTGGAPIGRA